MNKRSNAREVAFKLAFEYLFNHEVNDQLVNDLIDENPSNVNENTTQDKLLREEEDAKNYVYNVYNGIDQHFDELSKIIEDNAVGFSISRIFKVDYAILLVALYEIKYMPDIDYKVSINEALNLAKKYSTAKSKSFINGILAKVEKP